MDCGFERVDQLHKKQGLGVKQLALLEDEVQRICFKLEKVV